MVSPKTAEPPATFHYDRLGSCPEAKPFYGHWVPDTGNGDTETPALYQLDIARWGLNKNEHPVTVYSAGGLWGCSKNSPALLIRSAYGDVETYGNEMSGQETPNTQTSVFKYTVRCSNSKAPGAGTQIRKAIRGMRLKNCFMEARDILKVLGDTWRAFRKRGKRPFAGFKRD